MRTTPPLLACLLAFLATQAEAQSIYLKDEVAWALNLRQGYDSTLALPPAATHAAAPSSTQLQALDAALGRYADVNHPWYCFYKGTTEQSRSSPSARQYFGRALGLAANDPGTTWLLCTEFIRRGAYDWADSALAGLEGQLLTRGVRRVPLVAQQLLQAAHVLRSSGHTAEAERLGRAAQNFDPQAVWPALWRMLAAFPSSPGQAFDAVAELRQAVSTSWELQVVGAHYALLWLTRAALLLIAGMLVAMFMKHFARAIHPYVELFPAAVPFVVRTVLVGSVVLALLAFGVIPFFWVLAFLLWSYMWQRERLVVALCLTAVTLSPLAWRAEAALRACRAPESTPMLYAKAVSEGYYPDLHRQLLANLSRNPSDPLAHLGCALSALKADSLAAAMQHVLNAEKLRADDPMVLVVSGAVHNALQQRETARQRFERCMQLYPAFAAGYFNLGKAYLEAMETLKGADLITQSAKLSPAEVNGFVQKNDRHYGQRWPLLRHFILSDYPPGYFWRSVFPVYAGTWDDASVLWGVNFLGLAPLPSLLVFAVLLLGLLLRENVLNAGRRTRARRVLSCDLCRAPMCKRCSTGPYCHTCYESLRAIRIDQKRQAAKVQLHMRARRRESWTAGVLDVAYPGAGMFYESSVRRVLSVVFVGFTALLYGLVALLLKATYAYPRWVSDGLLLPLLAAGAVYVLAFVVRAVVISRRASTEEA